MHCLHLFCTKKLNTACQKITNWRLYRSINFEPFSLNIIFKVFLTNESFESQFIELSVGVLNLLDRSSIDDTVIFQNLSKEIPIFGQDILQLAVSLYFNSININ
jgi:hypothetical protein